MSDPETTATFDPPARFPTRVVLTAVIDVVVVAVFTLVGRATHAEPLDPGAWWHTAWPFLAGLTLGWGAVLAATRDWPTRLAQGVPVWIATLLGGMVLRALTGQGTATPFVLVASIFLAVTLIGWRVVAWFVLDRER